MRRIAQPLTVPPGVDYHRLSAGEHRWVFDELIVPIFLGTITPQDDPVTLYVMGPQGSGKSHTARALRRALRVRRPTRIEGGTFKSLHPDYRRLLQEEPRTASARIRADYRAWQEMAEAHVRAWRGDMLVEIAPDSIDHFLNSARRDHRAGRRVELLEIGTRAADSRLGTATRCAEVARMGVAPRFTAAAAHTRTFGIVPAVVRVAEASPYIRCVSVIRRDLTALYRNERTPDGAWGKPARGGDVVEVEQHRPYTEAEAARFLVTLQRLQGELPQYWADLVEIAAPAWPLMPAHLQPRTLASTITPVLLPVRTGSGCWPPVNTRTAPCGAVEPELCRPGGVCTHRTACKTLRHRKTAMPVRSPVPGSLRSGLCPAFFERRSDAPPVVRAGQGPGSVHSGLDSREVDAKLWHRPCPGFRARAGRSSSDQPQRRSRRHWYRLSADRPVPRYRDHPNSSTRRLVGGRLQPVRGTVT
ncbi:zeta toxin family protein [Streptomyces sp. NPDC093093]|uniref:zeta toxin family protein n=1 Tax=Streptomyces sp. NPDC093093 TaxID=3366025 RepID=UPI0038215FB3